MKQLFILRHAEAAAADRDFDRCLTPKGIADMQAMGRLLREAGLRPDFVLCSPAKRTRMTLENLSSDAVSQFPDRLYNADAGTIYEAVKGVSDSYDSMMVVAHNPGIFSFMRFLAAPEPDMPMDYKPGTLTVLECPIERWVGLMPGENKVVRILMP